LLRRRVSDAAILIIAFVTLYFPLVISMRRHCRQLLHYGSKTPTTESSKRDDESEMTE
jgi:hypothetical protein